MYSEFSLQSAHIILGDKFYLVIVWLTTQILFIFFIYFLISGKLLYDFVLVSSIQQYKSVIILYIYIPSHLSLCLLLTSHPVGHHRVPGWAP